MQRQKLFHKKQCYLSHCLSAGLQLLAMKKNKFVSLVCILLLPSLIFAQGCEEENIEDEVYLICSDLTDNDLPFTPTTTFAFYQIEIVDSDNLTTLPTNSFGNAYASYYLIQNNPSLTNLDDGFLGANSALTKGITFDNNEELSTFPWSSLSSFNSLETFQFSRSKITSLESSIPWPSKITAINLSGNKELQEIPAYAFDNAVGLETLVFSNISDSLNLRTSAFHIRSRNEPTLILFAEEPGSRSGVIEEDAFGNVEGGELWGKLQVALWDFPEQTFRLMLKTHFDLGFESLFDTTSGATTVLDCSCTISWLYKDSKIYGSEAYLNLVGHDNIICPGVGPVLETQDQDFVLLMESCPATEMPWPDACKDHDDPFVDTEPDPRNCHCFYKCDGTQTNGHDCCADGLAYSPSGGICDWEFNVPNCTSTFHMK